MERDVLDERLWDRENRPPMTPIFTDENTEQNGIDKSLDLSLDLFSSLPPHRRRSASSADDFLLSDLFLLKGEGSPRESP